MIYISKEDVGPRIYIAVLGWHAILFRVIEKTLRIERVLHGAKDLRAVLGVSTPVPEQEK